MVTGSFMLFVVRSEEEGGNEEMSFFSQNCHCCANYSLIGLLNSNWHISDSTSY